MRLIDADTIDDYLGEWADDFYENNPDADFMDGYCMVINKTQSHMIPIVDAVPVVRCKDCKHSEESHSGVYCTKFWRFMEYCSSGERKEE